MKEVIERVVCDKCKAKIDPLLPQEVLSEVAEKLATAFEYGDLCSKCRITLNKIAMGESTGKLAPRKKREVKRERKPKQSKPVKPSKEKVDK